MYESLLKEYGFDYMDFSSPPDTWNNEQKRLFDLANRIEDVLKEKIIECLQNENH